MSSEFRRAKRRKVDQRIEVTDVMAERLVGHLSDLSETGMLLIANQGLTSDGLYQLRFKLADPHGHDYTLEVGAHELWADAAAAPGQVWTGLRFIDLSASDLLFLRNWVAAPGGEQVS
ncbi:MAG: PilZ domain-containing protein [Frankiaceae bacterium]|nr:PilZ domain-containing protein [Arenimonas sp.]